MTISPVPLQEIPAPVLDLLNTAWEADEPQSLFATDFLGDRNTYLRANPAVRVYRPDDASSIPFEGAEVSALVQLEEFAGLVGFAEEGVAFNGHAENALVDFCRDTYAAYAKLKTRLDDIRAAQLEPIPPGERHDPTG